MYPFQRDWAKKFRKAEEERNEKAEAEKKRVEEGGPASRMPTVRRRQRDKAAVVEIQQIVNRAKILGASRTLQQISIAIKNQETVNAILMGTGQQ